MTGIIFISVSLSSVVGLAGCTTYPIADPVDLKNGRTQNNATLNNSDLVATAFVTREDLRRAILQAVPRVQTAEVLERTGAVFVGVTMRLPATQADLADAAGQSHVKSVNATNHAQLATHTSREPIPQEVVAQVQRAVREVMPSARAVYVSSDQTLATHFHMFSSDRATGRPTGSDMILDDITRVFPGYS